jgi:hypothetical protein
MMEEVVVVAAAELKKVEEVPPRCRRCKDP